MAGVGITVYRLAPKSNKMLVPALFIISMGILLVLKNLSIIDGFLSYVVPIFLANTLLLGFIQYKMYFDR